MDGVDPSNDSAVQTRPLTIEAKTRSNDNEGRPAAEGNIGESDGGKSIESDSEYYDDDSEYEDSEENDEVQAREQDKLEISFQNDDYTEKITEGTELTNKGGANEEYAFLEETRIDGEATVLDLNNALAERVNVVIGTEDVSERTRDISQALSESSDYDYRDGTLAPDADHNSLADSWDWTFPNSNVSELDIPAEQKYLHNSRVHRAAKKDSGEPPRREVSVGTQTDESSNLIGFQTISHNSNQTSGKETVSNASRSPQKVFKQKKKKRRPKKSAFDEDVIYFEDPSSSRVFKTKLLYLYTDSNVRLKSSSSWSEITGPKNKPDLLENRKTHNQRLKVTAKEFEQRNVKRVLSKLPNIESKFVSPRNKLDSKAAEAAAAGQDVRPEREMASSLSQSKSSHVALNSSMRLNGSLSDSHPVYGDTITERLMSWRLARGRTMSKPDVFSRSVTRDEIQMGTDEFLESVSEKQSGLERFQHSARLILLLLRAIGFKPQKVEENRHNFLSWTVVYDEVLGISRLNYDSGTLTFDPLSYKANKETTVSDEVKGILKLPTNQRTQAHIHTVKVCFKQVAPSFSEFPIRIQEAMIKVCTYEKFEAGRVIIRQGHRAENFYFILSGCAVVTELDLYANHAHTTNVLGKGNSFGELALLNMSQRSATVTCREDVELIWIERQDFIDIFMRRVVGKEADHVTFLKTVGLLEGWPVEALPPQNPKICAFTYVRRGVVLCHDSSKSDWIFVVVSGSCKILKALDDVPLNKQQKLNIANEKTASHLPTISVASASSNFASIYTMTKSDAASAGAPSNVTNNRARRQGIVQRPDLVNLLEEKTKDSVTISQNQHQSEIESLFLQKHVLPTLHVGRYSHDSFTERKSEHNSRKVSLQTLHIPQQGHLFQPKRQSYGLNPPVLPQLTLGVPETGMSDMRKVFIEVARLDSGDVFGLDQVVLVGVRKVTSYSLVSDGAEVVLINKRFFTKHLTEEALKIMRKKISPLPSEKVLQKNLETLKTWEAYKASTLARYASWRRKLADIPEFSR